MRKLSMKNKRKKSEAVSDCESEENGVTRSAATDNDEDKKLDSPDEEEPSSTESTPTTPKGAVKKRTRGRLSLKAAAAAAEAAASDEDASEGKSESEDEENGGSAVKGGAVKRRRRDDQKATTSGNDDSTGNEKEYEVEKIVGQRTIKGRRQYLVRWKGYDEKSDTWEHERALNCTKLIEKFLADNEDRKDDESHPKMAIKEAKSKTSKKETKKTPKGRHSIKKGSDDTEERSDDDSEDDGKDKKDTSDDGQKEFEVEKIIEVRFKKNKTREFLIRWKGFSSADDTWEPEENLNCAELIEKFMQKVEKAKSMDMRELRANRPHTKRYTVATPECGRRLSRRNMDKQRATYHECAD